MPFQNATRLYRAELEIRSSSAGDHTGRTISGIAVPYDSPTKINDYLGSFTEVFRRGAFARTVNAGKPERTKFLYGHDQTRLPIGHATLLREDPVGLYVEFRMSKTSVGDEVLELILDGTVDGLSVGFGVEKDSWNKLRTQREVLAAKLYEVSATPWPAYADAAITSVRDATSISNAARMRRMELTNKGWFI